ncbi:MAG: DUF4384 domain-containing protein, partial [Deltaproteobacteria bacterium]
DETKEIRVAPSAESDLPLNVQFAAKKSAYQVNEPIQFDVKLSKNAYVYLFNTRSGSATLIYPNRLDKTQIVEANKITSLPVQSQFAADRPGTEHLVMVASTEPLQLQTTKGISSDFDDISLNEVEKIRKNIQVESRVRGEKQMVEMDVVVQGKTQGLVSRVEDRPEIAAQPVVLVSTNKPVYGLNESMTIAFASDQDGYITLYAVNPMKEVFSFKEVKVEKDRIYRVKATTESPAGQHVLVGVYSRTRPQQTDNMKSMALKMSDPNTQKDMLKNIRVEDEPQAFVMHSFMIQN